MNLSGKFSDRSAQIGVLGLGYVGLPLAMQFCRKGFRVTGFEVDRGEDVVREKRSYGVSATQRLKKSLRSYFGVFLMKSLTTWSTFLRVTWVPGIIKER